MPTDRARWWIFGSVVAFVCAVALGIGVGPTGWSWNVSHIIVWQVRMPRVALAALVGAMLSLAGASYQGVFRNPLVDPYLLGVAAGAGLGATFAFANRSHFVDWPITPVPLAAFVGGLIAVATTYSVGMSFGEGRRSGANLVLAGVAVTSLFTAMQAFVLTRNRRLVQEVYSWILGRLTTTSWREVWLVLPYILASSTVLMLYRRQLDLLRVGEDEASALGVDVRHVRLVVVLAATLGTAAAVSMSGLIGFVGIVVPHAIRLVVGSSYRVIMPVAMFAGAAFLILADLGGRVIIRPAELQVGVVTAFVGAPFFIVLLARRKVTT